MRIGNLRRRIAFQARSSTVDTFGQQQTTWSDASGLSAVPAELEALAGRELQTAQAINAEVTHRITVRYHPLLGNPVAVAAMRINYTGRIFNILASMNVDERNREIEILASEGLNQG